MYALLILAAAAAHNYQYEVDAFVCVEPIDTYMLVLDRGVSDLGVEVYLGYVMSGNKIIVSELDLRKKCK